MVGKRGDVKREFANFAGKISKLESLRQELNALDTRGFKIEAKLIRAKLRDISAIPEIKKEINSLRKKIKHKISRGVLKSKIAKKLLEQSSNLQEDRKLMKKKIAELEEKISRKKRFSKKEIEDKKFMEEKIAKLEHKISKKRRKQLSGEEVEDIKSIPELKSLVRKKQLSNEEIMDIKDIPKLESQLEALKKDFEEHAKIPGVKIDTGVGVIVDSRYNEFISGIKAELTERLEAKEMVINNKIKSNLEEQKERFAEQYTNLTNEFHQKYKEKVKKDLDKDIKEKFKHMLERKLAIERKKITDYLIKEHARKLHDDRKKIVVKLESGYAIKQKNLENERKKLLEKEKESSDKIKVVKEKMYAVLVSKLKNIRRESDDKIKEKEEKLKSEFEKEYKGKLKKSLATKDKQLDKKKAELEKHIKQHAKELFG